MLEENLRSGPALGTYQLYCLVEVSCSKVLRTWTDPLKIMPQVNTEGGM